MRGCGDDATRQLRTDDTVISAEGGRDLDTALNHSLGQVESQVPSSGQAELPDVAPHLTARSRNEGA
jgi:hypothetical protein